MARPRKAANDQLTHRHIFRMTEAEADQLDELARQTGLTVSDVLRHLLRSGSVKVVHSAAVPFELVFELNKIGVNLNQIAYKFNATGQLVPGDLAATLERLNAVLMKAIGDGSENHER